MEKRSVKNHTRWTIKLLLPVFLMIVVFAVTGCEKPVSILLYRLGPQVEIISKQGVRVLIDVNSANRLSSPMTDDDILLTTISGECIMHVLPLFTKHNFKGEQLYMQEGEITRKDVHIRGIAASFQQLDNFPKAGSNNNMYLVEIDGIRILHTGNLGQIAFTNEQMKLLGDIDIAFVQIANMYAGSNMRNKKSFNLIGQLKPKIVLTHHRDKTTATYSSEIWETYYTENPLKVSAIKFDDDGKTKLLYLGESDFADAHTVGYKEWPY